MDQNALLKLFAAGALGYVAQWALFAPKKVSNIVAWGLLGVATLVLYFWSTPTAVADFNANWRYTLVGVVSFFLTARGTGATAVAASLAPRADSTGHDATPPPSKETP